MEIVIYTHYFKGGGAEKRASVYANYLFSHGVDVTLVSMHKTESEYYIQPGIKRCFVAESEEEYKKISKVGRLKRLKKILLDLKPTIVISFLTTYALYASIATKFCKQLKGVKLIYMVTLYQRKYGLKSKIVDWLSCLFADKISLQCKEQLKCNKLFKKKCLINYNPIEDSWHDDIERDYSRLSIISVGRLTDQKNFQLTIKGVALAHQVKNSISLDIFGDGPYKTKLQKLIKKLKAENFVKIHPFSFDLPKQFESHNVLISSSKYEGFPNGLVEGMMSGLVCLSTPCPTGPSEIIKQKVNGLMFKNRRELSENLLFLLSDSQLCKQISKQSRASVRARFLPDVVLPKLLSDLKNVK